MTKEEIQEKLRKQDDTVFEELITVDDLDFQGELELKKSYTLKVFWRGELLK